MIYINTTQWKPGDDWLARADAVTDEMKAAVNDDERHAIIDRKTNLWRELREELMKLSADKCWFSEAKGCFEYMQVEHFRPKKGAKGFGICIMP